jgi:hypothetical protein
MLKKQKNDIKKKQARSEKSGPASVNRFFLRYRSIQYPRSSVDLTSCYQFVLLLMPSIAPSITAL